MTSFASQQATIAVLVQDERNRRDQQKKTEEEEEENRIMVSECFATPVTAQEARWSERINAIGNLQLDFAEGQWPRETGNQNTETGTYLKVTATNMDAHQNL